MLRRLVHRFGEEAVSGVGGDANVPGPQSSGISKRVEEIELDVDSEEVSTAFVIFQGLMWRIGERLVSRTVVEESLCAAGQAQIVSLTAYPNSPLALIDALRVYC